MWYPQLWAEKSLCVCVCVCVTKTAFFGRFLRFLRFPFFLTSFPFFCSESERFCFVFPLFVHNPSAFRREVPSKLPRSPPKPRNVPRSPFTLRRRSCPVAQAPFSCSPPAVSARLRSKRCLDELGLHGPCGLPPLSGWQGGGRTRLVR